MITDRLAETLAPIAAFFDGCRFGYEGSEGYRKSTDLYKFLRCIQELEASGWLHPQRTVFADLGCADGRMNILVSYFVRLSIGIEIDAEILAEFGPRKDELYSRLEQAELASPPRQHCPVSGKFPDP